MERCSAAFASHVIIANHLWCGRLVCRSSRSGKCTVVRNHPDLDIFVAQSGRKRDSTGKFVLMYPGTLNSHQGVDIAIRAFASVAERIPEAEFHIYGEGPAKPFLIKLADELEMRGRIVFHDFLPTREIAQVMATADLAIEPKRATSAFGNEALSTKILEFMALGVPIVASKTRIHAYYYNDSIVQYYENDDACQLAEQILRLKGDAERRRRLVLNAKKYVEENNWDARKHEYLQLVDSLVKAATRV